MQTKMSALRLIRQRLESFVYGWHGFIFLYLLLHGTNILAQPPDTSWPVADYVRLGLPDPGHFWTANDYSACRDVLLSLDRTNRAALPRFDSPKSGPIFARLVNATNVLVLSEQTLSARERVRLFYPLLNRFPAFEDIYKLSIVDMRFHREAIELDHVFLRLARQAIEFDGKTLPLGPGENTEIIFHYAEVFYSNADLLFDKRPQEVMVPRGRQFNLLSSQCTAVITRQLPWLAEGTGLTHTERTLAAQYLRQDLPPLWKYFSPGNQASVMQDFKAIMPRVLKSEVRRELESLRNELSVLDQ
jgi:hypothetical protein